MTDINDAFATRIPLVGANSVGGAGDALRYDEPMVLPPMSSTSALYQPTQPNTSAHDAMVYASPTHAPLVAKPANYVIEGSPEHKALLAAGGMGGGGGGGGMGGGGMSGDGAVPVVAVGGAPAAAPAFVAAAGGGGGKLGYHQNRHHQGYFDRLGSRRREVVRLLMLALVISLGISVHWVASYYTQAWIGSGDFTDRQEFFARVVYPLGVLFVIWNIKAFQPPAAAGGEGGGGGGGRWRGGGYASGGQGASDTGL